MSGARVGMVAVHINDMEGLVLHPGEQGGVGRVTAEESNRIELDSVVAEVFAHDGFVVLLGIKVSVAHAFPVAGVEPVTDAIEFRGARRGLTGERSERGDADIKSLARGEECPE